MYLSDARCGDILKILRFRKNEKILDKIEGMGLREGSEIEVIQKLGRNYLIKCGLNRIVISEDLAKEIEVELLGINPVAAAERCKKGRGWCWRWGWKKF